MDDDKIDALFHDFSKLFEGDGSYLPHPVPISKKTVGFWCGNGWEPIVRKCLEKLAHLSKDIRVASVKQKWASLTIYASCPDALRPQCDQILAEAREESHRICEECGDPGQLYGPGSYKTVCKNHAEGRQVLCRTCTKYDLRGFFLDGVPDFCPDCKRRLTD